VVTHSEGCNRCVRVGARAPSLIAAIVALGAAPLSREALGEADALAASDAVVDAFVDVLARDYRVAQRTMMTTANPGLTEAQIRGRVNLQVAYCPRETAIDRLRAWIDDDPRAEARAVGERLWILSSPETGGAWFPPGPKLEGLIKRELPGARLERVEDGVVSRPDLTAAVVRLITARAAREQSAAPGSAPRR
jgi:hypothetical protein